MARLRRRVDADPKRIPDTMDLLIGPTHGHSTAEDLEVLWQLHGDEIMSRHRRDGRRPWAWWAFEAGEEQPRERWIPDDCHLGRMEGVGDETVRLAELGELTPEELAAIEEDANVARPRIGTDAERISGGWRNTPGAYSVDQQDVDLWERVQAAMKARPR